MNSIFKTASRVSTPLALAGIIATAFFFIAKQILEKNIFPKLSEALGGAIIMAIIDKLFMLAMVAACLGVAAYIIKLFVDRPKSPGAQAAQTLHFLLDAWKGTNHIECAKPVTPDVVRAGTALQLLVTHWMNELGPKQVMATMLYRDAAALVVDMAGCETIPKGFEKQRKTVNDFVPIEMYQVLAEMYVYVPGATPKPPTKPQTNHGSNT